MKNLFYAIDTTLTHFFYSKTKDATATKDGVEQQAGAKRGGVEGAAKQGRQCVSLISVII